MAHKIKRINDYYDNRFEKDVLKQHGAFVVDDSLKCSFKIVSDNKAIVYYEQQIDLEQIIDEFRFYSEHITEFYTEENILIKAFPMKKIFQIDISELQPSQFFVNEEKLEAIKSFIHSADDIFIPVAKIKDKYVTLDGHTRLYLATINGYKKIKVYFAEFDPYIEKFVEEARNRDIYTPYDLILLSNADYEINWHRFCDDFFNKTDL